MKLLICTSEYYPYGSGTANRMHSLVNQLQNMGVDCTVCSPTGPDIKCGSKTMIDKFGRLGLLYFWHQVSRYFKQRADDYDVAWLNYPLFIGNNPFKRNLVTMHITAYGQTTRRIYPLHLHAYYKLSAKLEKRSLDKVKTPDTRFSVLTPQGLKELTELGIDPDRITCIHSGVDVEKFKPAKDKVELRRRFNLPEDKLIILSLGRLNEVKQPYKLIEVFSLITKSISNIMLVVAGSGGLLEKTKRLAEKKGLDNVRFLGYVDHDKDAPALYACSDYYIMTSKYEGLPLTLLEAMASGLPCIVPDLLSMKVVEEAECGIMVDFTDETESARQITDYLRNDNSRHAGRARGFVVKNLTWEKVARRYLTELEELMQR